MSMEKDERVAIILKHVKNKDVLDIGCIDHDASKEASEEWLHKRIGKEAKSVLGLDNNKEEIEKLLGKYNIIFGDAQTIDLKRKFDCIVAGELIEHLENNGEFLKNMLRHLRPGGSMILTTPNPFYSVNIIKALIGVSSCENPEHVCWFCDMTLRQLLRRAGFDDVKIYFTNRSRSIWGRLPSVILGNKRLSSNIVAVAHKPLSDKLVS